MTVIAFLIGLIIYTAIIAIICSFFAINQESDMEIPRCINWHQGKQRYQVRITRNGIRRHVGAYKSLKEAKNALHNAKNSFWY